MTVTNNKVKSEKESTEISSESIEAHEIDLYDLLKKCYQCARCSGVCQVSKVQKFTPSRIIQMILEGFGEEIIESGILWDCITCNSCLQNCPKDINFVDIVRIIRTNMRERGIHNLDRCIAHKGLYHTIPELMSQDNIKIDRPSDWIPKNCNTSDKGDILYYVGCLPYFGYEFQNLDLIASSTLRIICQVEEEPVVVLKDEICCGHDIYWGQGKIEVFLELAKKNVSRFEKAGISTIVTACAECYRTFKVDYAKIFEDFEEKYDVKHIIDYVYDNWKLGKIEFKNPNVDNKIIPFTFHDPCRLSRFLPKDNKIIEEVREIFNHLKRTGYKFKEMAHNKENSLCCGVSSWMNCNERSKALRYKRFLEAKAIGSKMVTSCPKCRIHFNCLKKDYENIADVEIMDFSEFLVDMINLKEPDNSEEVNQ